jgi:rhodanese-related sulfurtransferase
MTCLNAITAQELKRRLDAGSAVLIDIRETDEYAREHIPGARLASLSTIHSCGFGPDLGKVAVFHCKSGMRTQANAVRLLACGFSEAYFLDGGIEAWKAAGYAVRSGAAA